MTTIGAWCDTRFPKWRSALEAMGEDAAVVCPYLDALWRTLDTDVSPEEFADAVRAAATNTASDERSKNRRHDVAYHEAGHAVIAYRLGIPVHAITALGAAVLGGFVQITEASGVSA